LCVDKLRFHQVDLSGKRWHTHGNMRDNTGWNTWASRRLVTSRAKPDIAETLACSYRTASDSNACSAVDSTTHLSGFVHWTQLNDASPSDRIGVPRIIAYTTTETPIPITVAATSDLTRNGGVPDTRPSIESTVSLLEPEWNLALCRMFATTRDKLFVLIDQNPVDNLTGAITASREIKLRVVV
jgi:hypothetical protein